MSRWTQIVSSDGTTSATVAQDGALKVDGSSVTQPVSGPLTDAQARATPLPVSGSLALSGSVAVSNFPATQPVSGTVAVSNLPATQPVSGAVSVSNFPASQAVTGAFYLATQPVSGSVSVSNFPASQAVTGTFYQATQPVSGTFWQTTQPVSGTFWPATQPVSGTVSVGNFPATQPVSGTVTATGPLTDTQLRATAVPVSGTVTATGPLTDTQLRATAVPVSLTSTTVTGSVTVTGPATDTQLRATPLPVSGTVTATGPLTDTQLRASAVPVSGPLTDTQLRASAVPVSGTFFQGTQPVSLAALPALASMGAASSTPTGVVSLGNTLGKANVMKTGSLASSATTADQVILTYTVTSAKTFYLEYLEFCGRLTTFATTATLLGTISLESAAGTKLYTTDLVTAGNQNNVMISFPEPIPIAAGVVVRVVCTPSASTAMTWKANFGGYEK